jgi:hypothetical protein
LGYIIDSEQGIYIDPKKVKLIKTWEPSILVRSIQGFLGFANYYQEFIPQFSKIAQPLMNLTKKDT